MTVSLASANLFFYICPTCVSGICLVLDSLKTCLSPLALASFLPLGQHSLLAPPSRVSLSLGMHFSNADQQAQSPRPTTPLTELSYSRLLYTCPDYFKNKFEITDNPWATELSESIEQLILNLLILPHFCSLVWKPLQRLALSPPAPIPLTPHMHDQPRCYAVWPPAS